MASGCHVKVRLAKLVTFLVIGSLAAPLVAGAQQADKVHRVGYLTAVASRGPFHQAFEQALGERGWVAGKNLVISYRFAEEKYERFPALAAELVRLEPHVIVAVPTAAARAAKNATSTIPIVMLGVADPIGEGLIAGYARPGGNVTGLTGSLTWATYAKQVQLLKETVPSARRMALLRDPSNPASLPGVSALTEAAKALGIELQVFSARAPEEFEPAFRAMSKARADALILHRESAFFRHLGRLADLSVRHRLPSISAQVDYAKASGLMTYAVRSADEARRVAGYVDRILRGANAAELPVEQPTKFELAINLKTAKVLGVTIPPALLLQADQVIE
jgi:putative ABC transport system substrate-binding protein